MVDSRATLPAIYTGPPTHEASLADVGRALRRKWKWVVVPTMAAFLGSLAFVNLVSPSYTGEAKVLLQSGDTYFTRPGPERGENQLLIDEQAVASQVQVVLSRDIAREAIKRLGLTGNPDFDPLAAGIGLTKRIAILLGISKNPLERPPEERILDRFYEHLLVYPVGKSRIVSVEFRSKDADLAARGANTVAELYLAAQEDAKKGTARSASSWLGSSIDDLRRQVAGSEAKVEAFRSRTGLLSGSGTGTLSSQQLSDLSTQVGQARNAQADAQAKARVIREAIRDGRTFEIPDVANNELIRRLIEQRITLRAQLALEQRTLLPQHPRIKELKAQLADLEAQVRGAAERTVRTLENDAQIAGSRVESLDAALDAQKRVVVQANSSEVQLRALEREARTQREQLESFLTRFREATVRDVENAVPPDARIVSRAVAPQIPSFPKPMMTVALATMTALALSIGTITAMELLGGAPSTARTVGALYAVPAVRPVGAGQRSTVAMRSSGPSTIDPIEVDGRYDFRRLVSRLAGEEASGRGRTILVTGANNGTEPRDVARGLALTVSAEQRTILIEIVDDMPAGFKDLAGFSDLVSGDASFGEVIARETGSQLHRVFRGTLPEDVLMEDRKAVEFSLSAFAATYDWVICLVRGAVADRRELTDFLVERVDAVVIASNLEPANQALVDAYERVQRAGAADVVVAREGAIPSEREAA